MWVRSTRHGHGVVVVFQTVVGFVGDGLIARLLCHAGFEANNGLKNDNYTVAMARTSDPHSATAQFFINVADNDFLNHKAPSMQGWGYAVFGKVVAGTDVVDKIRAVKTGRKGFHDDVPKEDVVIEKAVAL